MATDGNLTLLLLRLWRHVRVKRRRQFIFLLVLMGLVSLTEMVSIGAILPFLAVLTSPEKFFTNEKIRPLIDYFGILDASQLLLPITGLFAFSAVFVGIMRITLAFLSARISFSFGAELSCEIYRRTLYQPYSTHALTNSSEAIAGITTKSAVLIFNVINPFLTLVSSSLILIVLLLALTIYNPLVAISCFIVVGLVYFSISLMTRKNLREGGERIARDFSLVQKALQEGFGNIRDILIDGTQEVYCSLYQKADIPMRRAQGDAAVIAQCPRFGVEALGMVFIAFLAYFLIINLDESGEVIPILGLLALGTQRILPLLQQTYANWTYIYSSQSSLRDTLELLDQPLPGHVGLQSVEPMQFLRKIELSNISFRYEGSENWVLKNINLSISRGSRIGIIGSSGVGKSTLVDLVMSLLTPVEGTMSIDDVVVTQDNSLSWQRHIAHVPQSIFLADASIAENIALGVSYDDIDFERLEQSIRQSMLIDVIKNLAFGYRTEVGERGIRLSGGQRQRIGIARALYKKADVIIFDEATSALDSKTEANVIKTMDALNQDLTIIMIAHRLSTLKSCDFIVELKSGQISRIGSYIDFLE